MKSIDEVKAITIDERTYEAARGRSATGAGDDRKVCLVICNDETLSELDPVGRLDAAERTWLSTLPGADRLAVRRVAIWRTRRNMNAVEANDAAFFRRKFEESID